MYIFHLFGVEPVFNTSHLQVHTYTRCNIG